MTSNMQSLISTNLPSYLQKSLLIGVVIGLALVTLSWILVPATPLLSVVAAIAVLFMYGLAGRLCPPFIHRINARILRWASLFGLLAGGVFASEIVLEYVILPADNSLMSLLELGTVFSLYFLSGLVVAYRTKSLQHAILTSGTSAIISSLIWLITLLTVLYAFRGTPQQAQVFRAEGNYEDFARSGMSDFDVFIMEDFMGATFFHLLLGPFVAIAMGALGGLLGKGTAYLRKR